MVVTVQRDANPSWRAGSASCPSSALGSSLSPSLEAVQAPQRPLTHPFWRGSLLLGEQPSVSAACGLLWGGHPTSSAPGVTWWKKAGQWCAGFSRNSLKLDDGFESCPPSAAVHPVVGYWVSPGCFRIRTRRVRDGRAGGRLSSQSPGTESPAHTSTVTAGSPPGWPSPPPPGIPSTGLQIDNCILPPVCLWA